MHSTVSRASRHSGHSRGISENASRPTSVLCTSPEVLTAIFLHVSDQDLLINCRPVCRLWLSVIDGQSLWKRRAKRRSGCHVPKWPSRVFSVEDDPEPPPVHFYRTIAIYNPFGRNLVVNPCGQTGNLQGWTVITSEGDGWKVEDPPKGSDPLSTIEGMESEQYTSCFATSYAKCSKYQLIDLRRVTGFTDTIIDRLKPQIYICEWYAGRFDCRCQYILHVKLLAGNKKKVLDEFKFEHCEEQWAGRVWNKVEHTFKDHFGARYVHFEHAGVDRQFWAGHYGSKMTNATVRLIVN